MDNSGLRLSLCMIVRNEEERLKRSIASTGGQADEIVIVDTGSSDRTVSIAKDLATLTVQIPWKDDFSEARNISLEEATGDWILVMDADETLHPDDIPFLKKWINEQNPATDGLSVRIINRMAFAPGDQEEHFAAVRLFRNNPAIRYRGAIHEQIHGIPTHKIASSSMRIIHHGELRDTEKRKNRCIRNVRILLKETQRDPADPFHLYNLGVEYTVQRRFRDAVNSFERAKTLGCDHQAWASRMYKLLVYGYMEMRQWEQADSTLEAALCKYPDYTDLYYVKGMLRSSRNQYKEAAFAFYHCLALGDATNPRYLAEKGMGTDKAYFALGSVYDALDESQKSLFCYQCAFLLNPNHIEAAERWMEGIFRQQADIRRAVSLIVSSPSMKSPLVWLALSRVLADKGEFKLSREFQKTASINGAAMRDIKANELHRMYLAKGSEKACKALLSSSNSPWRQELFEELHLLLWKERSAVLAAGAAKFPDSHTIQAKKEQVDSSAEKLKMELLLKTDIAGD